MNGAVTVSSRPGATTFMLDLPAESARGAPVRRRRRLTPPTHVSTWKRMHRPYPPVSMWKYSAARPAGWTAPATVIACARASSSSPPPQAFSAPPALLPWPSWPGCRTAARPPSSSSARSAAARGLDRRPAGGERLRPSSDLRPPRLRGRDALRRPRCRRSDPGVRLRRRRQRHDPDERPRRHQRCRRGRRRRAWGREALRRVQGSRPGAGTDRRLGSVQRRGGRPRRPGCPRAAPVPLGTSSTVVVGTPVAAIGSPFDEQSSLSVGVVSATDRTIDSLTSGYSVSDAIQTDAPINRGNSGGPLFDAAGPRDRDQRADPLDERDARKASASRSRSTRPGARSSSSLRTGKVSYAYVGVTTQDVTPGLAQKFGSPRRRGALVAKVEPGTPAARAGLRGGTRTAEYNGLDISLGGDLIVRSATGRSRARRTSPVR